MRSVRAIQLSKLCKQQVAAYFMLKCEQKFPAYFAFCIYVSTATTRRVSLGFPSVYLHVMFIIMCNCYSRINHKSARNMPDYKSVFEER